MADEKPDTENDEIGAEALEDVAGGSAVEGLIKGGSSLGGGSTDQFLKIDPLNIEP